jgi:hypothetical protein
MKNGSAFKILLVNKGLFFFLLFFVVCFPFRVCAKSVNAEIINLNHDYHVAFVDLGEGQIHPGDWVVVAVDEQSLFMEVDEVTSVLSRLIPSKEEPYVTDMNLFSQMSIGNPISRILSKNMEEVDLEPFPVTDVVDPQLLFQADVERLTKELELKEQLLLDARRDNQMLRQQISSKMLDEYTRKKDEDACREDRERLKQKVDVLEGKIRTMHEIVEKEFVSPE